MMSDFNIFSRESYSLQSKHFRPYFATGKMSRLSRHLDVDVYGTPALTNANPAVAGPKPRDPLEPIQFPDSTTPDDIEEPFNPPEPADVPVPDNSKPTHPSNS